MKIKSLISKVNDLPNCKVFPPSNTSTVRKEGFALPKDLVEFYNNCDGILLYNDSKYRIEIVPFGEFKFANPIIIGERCDYDISSKWFIIAKDNNGDFITIDLAPARLGLCYDSFWDRHGVPGECSIVASSFTDLLERLINNNGAEWYWLKENFISLGDAYD